jgi:catechol-2,3-dioxygenase
MTEADENMPDLLGILETSLYVDTFERACPFYEQVLGLNSIYRDPRLCAYDVGGRGVLLLFLRGGSLEPAQLPGGTIHRTMGMAQSTWRFPSPPMRLRPGKRVSPRPA